MKRLILILLAILSIGCQEKDNHEQYHASDLEGTWYGSIGKQFYSDENERYLRLDFDGNCITLTPVYTSITSGWYEGSGTYTLGSDNVVRFNITTDIPDILESIEYSDITYKTITHAEIMESGLSGTVLKVYYDSTKDNITESTWMWFTRTKSSSYSKE